MAQSIRFGGLTLTVESIERSIAFYAGALGLQLEWNAAPAFALVRGSGELGGTIGILSAEEAGKSGVGAMTPREKRAVVVELCSDDLDGLRASLASKGCAFRLHPSLRLITTYDPDGYAVEIARSTARHVGRESHPAT
ncbi:MAG: VOC family protein [Polyangiales bacterium]